jgi:hypothetical protein
MFHRHLVLLFLAAATATLAAQSTVSFETYGDTYQTDNSTLVAGDFNNDGKPDLIECCNSSTQMVFRAGNGDGTFEAPVTAFTTPVAIGSMVAVDVNGDGNLDLVAVAAQNPPPPPGEGYYYLTVWLGNGNGTFQAPQTYSTTEPPQSVMVGNFFGDGHPDAAVVDGSSVIDLFRNQGNGTFILDKSINMGGGPYAAMSAGAGDFNGTGVSDLAVLQLAGTSNGINYANPQQLYVLWNNGSGTFTQQELDTAYNFPQIAISRLNGDAMMDILVSYACPDNNQCLAVDAYYGQGNNTVYKRTLLSSTTGINPGDVFGLAGVDVNGDGFGDIVAFGDLLQDCPGGCPTVPAGVFVWLGNADGSFQQAPQQFITSNDAGVGTITMADFNRDGMMDFAEAVPGADGGTTEYYINATDRTACGTYTISPTVTVCQPVDNTYSASPVRVEANAYDMTKVTAMQEYVDGTLEYSEPVTSFNQTFSASTGVTHLFVTKAWDTSGRSFVADRNVTVYTGTPGSVCSAANDAASICLPLSGTTSSPVQILANGNTGASLPTAAQLYIDGKLVVDNQSNCSPNDSCYGAVSYVQTTQDLATGTHNLVFKVWDIAGTVYEAQKTITVN